MRKYVYTGHMYFIQTVKEVFSLEIMETMLIEIVLFLWLAFNALFQFN
jgi:hypothetical protein